MSERSETPISRSATEIVNLLLALFSWILPDITIEIKVGISIVLMSLLVIARINPKFITRTISVLGYFVLIASPIAIGVLESWIVWLFFYDDRFNVDFLGVTQSGFAFGLIVGLPILIIGMWTSKNKTLGMASLIGLFIEVFRLVSLSDSSDVSGTVPLESLGPWILVYVSMIGNTIGNAPLFYVGIFLQNFQFEFMGLWISKLWSKQQHVKAVSKPSAG